MAFAVGPIGAALLALITLPIITWLFPQEVVGKLAMLQVAVGFSTLLFSLGLDQAYVREFHEVNDQPALLKHALIPGLLLLAVTLLLALTFGGGLAGWLFDSPYWQLSAFVAVILIGDLISRFLSLILRMNERGMAFSMSQLLPRFLLLVIVGVYLIVEAAPTFTNLVLASMASVIIACIILGFYTFREWSSALKSRIDRSKVKSMLRFGFPLIIGGVAYWGLSAVDKLFLRSLAGFEELAIYSVSVSFAGAAIILQSIFSTVWAPTVYKWASKGEGLENINSVTRYILFLVVIFFCLAGMLSWVVTVFLPDAYTPVQWLLVSCLAAPLLYTLSETTVVGIGITRRTNFAMIATVIAFLVNLVGNWIMIPIYGAAGAAVSTCISFWIFFVLRTEFSIYVWRPIPRILLYSYTLLAVIGAGIFTLYGEEFYSYMMFFWMLLFVFSLLSFKGEIKSVLNFVAIKIVK